MEGRRSPEFKGKPIEQVGPFFEFPDHPMSGLLADKWKRIMSYERNSTKMKKVSPEDFYQDVAEFLATEFPLTKDGEAQTYEKLTEDEKLDAMRAFSRFIEKRYGMRRQEREMLEKIEPGEEEKDESRRPEMADDPWYEESIKKAAEENLKIVKDLLLDSDSLDAEARWEAFSSYAAGAKISEIAKELETTVSKAKKILEDAKIVVELNRDKLVEPEEEKKVA